MEQVWDLYSMTTWGTATRSWTIGTVRPMSCHITKGHMTWFFSSRTKFHFNSSLKGLLQTVKSDSRSDFTHSHRQKELLTKTSQSLHHFTQTLHGFTFVTSKIPFVIVTTTSLHTPGTCRPLVITALSSLPQQSFSKEKSISLTCSSPLPPRTPQTTTTHV